MPLTKISDSVFLMPGRTNIGVIKIGNTCILIDSGMDKDEGKKILKELGQNNLLIKAIINTHSHADHCGANNFIKQKTNCKVFAPKIEAAFIEAPILEPTAFFSGAAPIKELKNKFICAEESKVDEELSPGKKCVCEMNLEIVPLKGHSINQLGVIVDNILFCGDSLFSKEVLDKHKIPFFTDITETKKTLDYISKSTFSVIIPSHAPQSNDIKLLAQQNLDSINKCEVDIIELLKVPKNTDDLITAFCIKEDIAISSIQQYFLLRTTILAYITRLQEMNLINPIIKDNTFLWAIVKGQNL